MTRPNMDTHCSGIWRMDAHEYGRFERISRRFYFTLSYARLVTGSYAGELLWNIAFVFVLPDGHF